MKEFFLLNELLNFSSNSLVPLLGSARVASKLGHLQTLRKTLITSPEESVLNFVTWCVSLPGVIDVLPRVEGNNQTIVSMHRARYSI